MIRQVLIRMSLHLSPINAVVIAGKEIAITGSILFRKVGLLEVPVQVLVLIITIFFLQTGM